MYDENEDNAKTLQQMRDELTKVIKVAMDENVDSSDKVTILTESALRLNQIIDNHEARLRLIERCFNNIKQVYSNYNLNN